MLKSSCPKGTALSAALRCLGAGGKIVTTTIWAKLSPWNIPYCKQEVPWLCKNLPLPKKQQLLCKHLLLHLKGLFRHHCNPLESKELPSNGERSLGSSKWWTQVRGVWKKSQGVAGVFTEQMQVILWMKSIKVVVCAFQMCREPLALSNKSQFCL